MDDPVAWRFGKPDNAPAPYVVDAHAHFAAPDADQLLFARPERKAELAAFAEAGGEASARHNRDVALPMARGKMADLSQRLADLDAMGCEHQVIAPSPDLYAYWADRALAAELVAAVNEAGATLAHKSQGRLTPLALVALQHPGLAADQLAEAMDNGFAGAEISASVGARELSDPVFDPFWSVAEETGAVVFIHPLGSTLGPRLSPFYLSNAIGQPCETTIALSHVIFGGVLDRFPNLRLLAAHGGGYLPAYIGRSDHAWKVRPEARSCDQPPSHYLSRIWFDSIVFDAGQYQTLIDTFGADRVLWGTDYPFDMGDYRPDLLAAEIPESAHKPVFGGNAAGLFNISR